MNITIKPVYKCHLCGRLLSTGSTSEIDDGQLLSLLEKFVQNQMFAGNQYLHKAPMYIPCKCTDGSGGLAYFVGFKKIG